MKRVAVNDPVAIGMLANSYHHGLNGFQQDHIKAIELFTMSVEWTLVIVRLILNWVSFIRRWKI